MRIGSCCDLSKTGRRNADGVSVDQPKRNSDEGEGGKHSGEAVNREGKMLMKMMAGAATQREGSNAATTITQQHQQQHTDQ